MAVYTEVSNEELDSFVAQYDIGSIRACKGIAEGVENSNFLLQTSSGSYEMEVAGSNSFDRLVVNGNASLAGTLEVVPLARLQALLRAEI